MCFEYKLKRLGREAVAGQRAAAGAAHAAAPSFDPPFCGRRKPRIAGSLRHRPSMHVLYCHLGWEGGGVIGRARPRAAHRQVAARSTGGGWERGQESSALAAAHVVYEAGAVTRAPPAARLLPGLEWAGSSGRLKANATEQCNTRRDAATQPGAGRRSCCGLLTNRAALPAALTVQPRHSKLTGRWRRACQRELAARRCRSCTSRWWGQLCGG